jgi:hypothetical protein
MLNEYDGLDTHFTMNELGEIPDPINDLNITFTTWGNIGLLALAMLILRVVAYGALKGMVKRQGVK